MQNLECVGFPCLPLLSLSLKQTGLATQGRGLDNEDLPCFESEKVTAREKRGQHVPRVSKVSKALILNYIHHPSQMRPMR